MAKKKKQNCGPNPEENLPEQEHGTILLTNENGQSPDSVKVDELKVKVDELKKESLLLFPPELEKKISEALETGRFFITVTFQKKYKPDDEHDLHHFYIRKNFMVNDVVPSLKKLASNFIGKENPTAEMPDKNGWH